MTERFVVIGRSPSPMQWVVFEVLRETPSRLLGNDTPGAAWLRQTGEWYFPKEHIRGQFKRREDAVALLQTARSVWDKFTPEVEARTREVDAAKLAWRTASDGRLAALKDFLAASRISGAS